MHKDTVMLSANYWVLLFFFSIWIPFIYFSSLIAMTSAFKSISNNSSKCGHHCLVSYLRINYFCFSTLKILFVVGLSCWPLLCWSRFLCILLGNFKILDGSRILSKAFSASIEMIILFSNSQFFNMIDLYILNCSCTSWIKLSWSQSMILLLCCWMLFVRFLLGIFTSIFICNIGLNFSFILYLCLVLVSGWLWSHRTSLGIFLPLVFPRRV